MGLIMQHVSRGNLKLPRTTWIFNLGPAEDCPSKANGLCDHANICYAAKAERMYKATLPYRQRQTVIWSLTSPDRFARKVLEANSRARIKCTAFRFNESGDFWGQACVDKMSKIADILWEGGIQTYTYTSRSDLDFSNVGLLVVNGSGFMVHNNFYIVDKFMSGDEHRCRGDCSVCSMCMHPLGFNIAVEKH